MNARSTWITVTVVALATLCSRHAQAVVYEGFSYEPEMDVTTVASTATNLGAWTSTGEIVGTTDSTGLAFGDLETTGGALRVTTPGAQFDWEFLDAPVAAGGAVAIGGALYGSYLFQFVGPGGGGGTGEFQTTNNFGVSVGDMAGGTDVTMQHRVRAYGTSPNVGRIGYEDENWAPMVSGDAIFDMTPYLLVGKWTNLGGASEATGWILNLANFDAISGDGSVTEEELSANSVATNSDLEENTAGSFGVGQFVKIGDFIGQIDVNYIVDEIRFSGSLADVVPVADGGALEGDFDDDTYVDGGDILLWQRDFQEGELADWVANFGAGPDPPFATIPEPASALLAMLGWGALHFRRGKR